MASKGELSIILSRFLQALKNRDYSAITWTFMSPGFRVLGLLCSVLAVPILWILKPVFWLKVGRLSSARIGHLALNTDLFLRRRQLGIYPDGPFYCFLSDPRKLANRQLLTMFKRVIPVCESRILILMFVGMLPILKRTPFYQDLPLNNNEYYEFNNAKPSISFTPNEIEKGRKLLKQMNVDLDRNEFVCIFARDDAYLKHAFPYNNWDYHNTRNADIDKFIEVAKYLIEKGFLVIRMGSVVNKPINFSHEKMIDYPYSGQQSDFLDIFIHAHCKFVITAGSSGINCVANIFDRPVVHVNTLEFAHTFFGKNCLYIPRRYKHSKTGDHLRFEDALKIVHSQPLFEWENPADFGLEIKGASSQDILEVTQEMLARLEGKFKYSPESKKLLQAHLKLWKESNILASQYTTPIGIAWLKKNQSLYF